MKNARSNEALGAAAGRRAAAFVAVSIAALALAIAPPEALAQRTSARPARPVAVIAEAGGVFVHEPGFGRGLQFGLGVSFVTGRRAAFEIAVERFEVPVEEGAGQDADGLGGLASGRMDLVSIVLSQHVYILTRGPVRPFATVGVGFDFIGYTPDEPAAPPERDIVDRMALQLGGGADIRLTGRLALTGRVRYNMAKTWIEEAPFPERIRDVDPLAQHRIHLFGLGLSLGLKATF
jgi:opacity protein-like surface antigen